LTKKEKKKLRRQKRLERQRDEADKIKLGLLKPPPAKIKLSNMMKLLTSDAI
jgi:U4/U6 small nuclear ribonucleoprotein PRP3